ncbi:MAG: amidohydrolase [Anaerolineae bacterium]|nr:amidohydrolase [Anaerolineae bacterium]
MPDIIDSHTHIGLEAFLAEPIPAEKRSRPAFRDPMCQSIEDLIERMDTNGVRRAIAFGFPLKEIDRVRANAYVLTAYQTYPDRIIPFMLVGDDTDYWLTRGACGFKQQNILYAPERFNLMRAYHVMAEAGVPMLIHFRAGPGYSVPQQVRAILAEVPRLKLIVAHMGRHTPNTSHRVEEALCGLRDYPNVIFETSTVRDPAMIARAVEIIGPGRVVFGSDYPFNSYQDPDPLAEELAVIARTGLSEAVRRQILGENMRAFLGLAKDARV